LADASLKTEKVPGPEMYDRKSPEILGVQMSLTYALLRLKLLYLNW